MAYNHYYMRITKLLLAPSQLKEEKCLIIKVKQ